MLHYVSLLITNFFLAGCFFNANIANLNDDTSKSNPKAPFILNVSLNTADTVPYLSTKNIDISMINGSENDLEVVTVQVSSYYEQVQSSLCSGFISKNSTCNQSALIISNGEASQIIIVTANFISNGEKYTVIKEVILNGSFPGTLKVENIYSSNGKNWNDYVKWSNKEKTAWEQADDACDPAIANIKFSDCIHGGEKLKIRTGRSTCQDLTIIENLGVFNWTCIVINSQAYFVSLGLKDQKGLRDLISSSGWKSNYVDIFKGSTKILTTPTTGADSIWWSNPIASLPDNSSSNALYDLTNDVSGVGKIYYFDTNRNIHSYRLLEKVSIVSLNGASLIALPTIASVCSVLSLNYYCMINLVNSFNWIEVNLEKHQSTSIESLIATQSRFTKILNSSLKGSSGSISGSGIYAQFFKASTIQNTFMSGFLKAINLDGFCTNNFFEKLYLKSSGNSAISFEGFSKGNLLRNIFSINNTAGIYLYSGDTTVAQGVSISSVKYDSIIIESSEGDNIQSVAIFNSGLNSSTSAFYSKAGNNVYTNIAITNSAYGIRARYGIVSSNSSKFDGILLLGNNGTDCDSNSPLTGIINTTCADSYTDGVTTYTGSQSNAILRTNRTAVSSFKGIVTTNDINNTIDTLGLASFASILIPNWSNFDNPFRVFAPAGSTHIDAATKGPCTSGNCQIFDWSLLSTDDQFRNISETGDSASPNGAFVNGETCPNAISGNKITADFRIPQQTYLTNAWELIGDGIGDEDGLCESNEACLYTPNIGAYQGHGDYYTQTCLFQDGVVSGVKMYAYPNNGYW